MPPIAKERARDSFAYSLGSPGALRCIERNRAGIPMADITSEDISTAALDPVSATADGVSATARPIPEMITARNDARAEEALSGQNAQGGPRSGWSCLRSARVRPTGAV